MTHLIMALYASPDSQEQFMKEVNNWRYPVEGKYRKGRIAPYVSELKFYDIRLPEDTVKQFLIDTHASTLNDLSSHLQYLQKNKFKKVIMWIIQKCIKVLGIEVTKPVGKRIYQIPFWHNFYAVAKLKDDQCKNVLSGEEREVL